VLLLLLLGLRVALLSLLNRDSDWSQRPQFDSHQGQGMFLQATEFRPIVGLCGSYRLFHLD
jgi:hypothetical protein